MKSTLLFLIAAFSCVALAAQAGVKTSERVIHEMSIAPLGSFWIDNPLGAIDVTGSDIERVSVTAVRTVYAADRSALDDARENCVISWEGDDKVRLVRTLVRPVLNGRCTVEYTVQLPRSSDVKIAARAGDVRVRNMNGSVTVKSFTGTVLLSGVTGASAIDIVNGHVVYDFLRNPISNAQAVVVNGDIDVFVPADANFEWTANTLAGDLLTTMPVRGSVASGIFHGHFNAPGGPTINTSALLGRVRIMSRGTNIAQARSVRVPRGQVVTPPASEVKQPVAKVQTPIIHGAFTYTDSEAVMDVSIGEVRGNATIATQAGSIELGVVYGDCNVSTKGGPINLGEIMGALQASTGAGDILIRAARLGGDIQTGGGIMRLLYTGGPTTLTSTVGGDIVVRQAAGPIVAQTPSGDINLTVDPTIRTQRMEARTAKGNITLNVSQRFAADIDAIVMTSDPDANAIHSDFPSLTVRREQVAGGRTRIHLTGKINGGGDRVELYADNGDITISTGAQAPVSVVNPPNP